jgi:RNA polymerase sigma-70 factor (ECF subfamily)
VDHVQLEARRRFEELSAQVYVPLQRYLARRADRHVADDVLADVLLVLWRRLDDVPVEAPLAWAYGVARRCLANAVRADARREQLVRRLAALPAPTAPEDARLMEAIATLGERDRELLYLWAWEQLPPREIAVALDISANAASIRLHRAVGKLRVELTRKDKQASGHLPKRQGEEAS